MPAHVIEFMKKVPTTWDETVFIDGYPGKYCVLARRHGNTWYIAGINAEEKTKTVTVSLPMLSGKEVMLYSDNKGREPQRTSVRLKKNNTLTLSLLPGGGNIIVGE